MNDPNGMVYFDGEYHLFYQYYPDGTVWGPMHWGHAISQDLVSWEHLPIALYPDSLGYIFSGSAVVDWNNTSGFQAGEEPPLIAIYTYHDPAGANADRIDYQTQGIAFSNDKGRTWTKYAQNPILLNPGIRDFRDPKVMWHDASNQWIMTLAVKDRIHFYGSPDLKTWIFLSEFGADEGNHGGVWECPDLFPLTTTDGDTRWILLVSLGSGAPNGGSGTQYFIGSFDGTTFTNDNAIETEHWLDWGRDNYAGVTWSDILHSDGRRLFIGWMSNWAYAQVVPTDRWRSAMTLPRSLHLVSTTDGLRVTSQPISELHRLRGPATTFPQSTVETTFDFTGVAQTSRFEGTIAIDLNASTSDTFGILLSNALGDTYRFGYNRTTGGTLFSDRIQTGPIDFSDAFAAQQHTAPYTPSNNHLTLHIYVDHSSIEVFVDNGQRVMTELFFPTTPFTTAHFFSEGGTTNLAETIFYPLDTIWD